MSIRLTGNDYNGVVVDAGFDTWIIREGEIVANTGLAFLSSYDGTTLIADGRVVSQYSTAIYSNAASFVLDVGSTGNISGFSGMQFSGSNVDINNAGRIVGRSSNAIDLSEIGAVIGNSGTIEGRNDGIVASAGLATVNNTGTIHAYGIALSGSVSLVNGGVISGDIIGVKLIDASATVMNTGTIMGTTAILGAAGTQTITNTGLLAGNVYLAGGNDVLDSRHGIVAGNVYGGDGNDILRGGAATDVLYGDAGNDRLVGNGGDDVLYGGTGNDTLHGGSGADEIRGGSGIDRLLGGADDDILYGDTGNDVIFGGRGNDDISGGAGHDFLFGGADADSFIFAAISDSNSTTGFDVIRDFQRGLDRIYLDSLNSGDLAFFGTGALVNGTAGLRYSVDSGGSATVIIDSNGNGVEDMRIFVSQVGALSAADFFL